MQITKLSFQELCQLAQISDATALVAIRSILHSQLIKKLIPPPPVVPILLPLDMSSQQLLSTNIDPTPFANLSFRIPPLDVISPVNFPDPPKTEYTSSTDSCDPGSTEPLDRCKIEMELKYELKCEAKDDSKLETTSQLSDHSKKIKKEEVSPMKLQGLPELLELVEPQTQRDLPKKKRRFEKEIWSKQQDEKLLQLLEEYGQRWTKIGRQFGKTGKQVRDRYLNSLRPGIKHGPWNKEEELLFLEYAKKFGHRWCKIAEMIPGRTENQVKNKYHRLKSAWGFKIVDEQLLDNEGCNMNI